MGKKIKLSLLLVLITFMTLYNTGSVLACEGGGGGGDADVTVGAKGDALQQFFDGLFGVGGNTHPAIYDENGSIEFNQDLEFVDENGSMVSVDRTAPVQYVEPMTEEEWQTVMNVTAYGGGLALAYATSGWSIPVSAAAGGYYAYATARSLGASEMEARRSGVNAFLGGLASGSPGRQATATETLTYMQDHSSDYSAPTNNPYSGAELSQTTGIPTHH